VTNASIWASRSPGQVTRNTGTATLKASDELAERLLACVGDFTLHITDVLFGITTIYCLAGAIESLNAKLRRALKTRGHLPNDDAATKHLFLVSRQAAKT
jgi:hypothetical protein